jgi:hypothetical protein
MNLPVILLGVLSSALMVISALSVHRLRLLCFSLGAGALVAIEYLLVGAWTGLAAVLVGMTWTGLLALAYRYPRAAHPALIPVVIGAHTLMFALLTNFAAFQPVLLVPLVGGVLGTLAVYTRELIYTKALLIGIGVMWLGYEFNSGIYGQMLGESLNLVANTVALCALVGARMRGIPRSAMQDLDTQLIETITGAITLPRPYRGVENRYPAASLGGWKKPVRGAHPNSVGYARMGAEYERARAQMREEMLRRFEEADEHEVIRSGGR